MGAPKRTVSPDDVLSPATRAKAREASRLPLQPQGDQTAIGQLVRVERVLEDLLVLVGRGDGWMRWTADRDGKTVFLKYKFTSYQYPNHYVFVSGPIYDVALLVAALVRKCELVDAGQLKPTLDKPYSHM
jgi:hypothetical protein